jgi:simple sugar transport system permease protein
VLLIIGKNPIDVFSMMFADVFGSGYGLGQTLFKATPLIICGCGLAVCFHASIFNIGAEGQLNAGSFVMALTAYFLSGTHFLLAIPLSLFAGILISGLFGLIPAYIKVKKGVSEVITTIMMNFIVLALINFFLIDFFAVKSTVHTEKITDEFMISKLSDFIPLFQGSSVNLTFIFALALAVLIYFLIYKTKIGYKIRSVGFNENASRYIGIKVNKIILFVFFIGAGLTSLVGMNFIMGYKGYYEFGFSNNLGFTAIAVALLAKNNPLGIVFSALLFGFLDYGGLAVNTIVPKEIMFVIQGIVILTILSVDKLVEKYYLK